MKSLTEFIKEQILAEGYPIMEDEIWTGDCYLFEMANMLPEDTDLKWEVWLDQDRPKHNARLKFERKPGKWTSVYILRHPDITNDQKEMFSSKELEQLRTSRHFKELCRWIRGNRIALLLLWDKKLKQGEILQILRPLSEITDGVLKKEDNLRVEDADPDYYRTLKHRNLPPKTLDELMEIVYDEIEKNGPDCDLNHIDTSNIRNMSGLFDGIEFTGDISTWDVSNVLTMSLMFKDCPFNGDISRWNVSKVKNMTCMFMGSDFNSDISNWQLNPNCSTWGMFENCPINENNKPKLLK